MKTFGYGALLVLTAGAAWALAVVLWAVVAWLDGGWAV